ncbi:SDR family oxidoreductase [Crenobacter intestini]|uniref:SDR family oxidoreductase n=1 Tax=Crenobacter intestini TaxID=2563443 RepID=A0A4T0V771_9NEIS|nr:SDR family oxidoreductase [Crenobacter intestini]TIC87237.1 SDR family oxidoreductase [Crenobacter intestini]
MHYLVTGASGFIGRRLVRKLLEREGSEVTFLVLEHELPRVAALLEFWGVDETRARALVGDLTRPLLGVDEAASRQLAGTVDHFFHLAAVYDLKADAQTQQKANVDGTRNAVRFAEALGARHFHLFSSIAAAGLYEGTFREDMFDEAEHLEHPYFRTKHDSEAIVRRECSLPWRIYRPALVVGDSQTGEMDKIDGPYYFFKLIQKTRRLLPPWMPTLGVEGGRINVVPVDFIVAAVDHIAHLEGEDGRCFHLVDPEPMRVGDLLNTFARAAHAPQMELRFNAALFGFIPRPLLQMVMALAPVRRVRDAVMADLGLPDDIFRFINYPTRFDCRETQRALKDTGIEVPRLADYAWRLWDYWERHLDPDLFVDRSLRGQVEGRVVLVTGATSGIGKATALKLAKAGATVLTIARDEARIAETQAEFEAEGLKLHAYQGDIADLACAEALTTRILADFGHVDVLVNNAGRSIRRAIEESFDRFHDFERTMQLNYFGALKVSMGLLPSMAEQRRGHIINISSIGVLTNAPRFSAYVASKAALDAWARTAASEFADRGVHFSVINMPLVKTPMIEPTKAYDHVPTLTAEEAADIICDTIIHKQVRVATRLGIFGQVMHALAPRVAQVIMNTSFRTFGGADGGNGKGAPSANQVAMGQLMRGIYF